MRFNKNSWIRRVIIPESDDMFLFFRERVTESFGPCETPQTWRRQTRLNRLGPNRPGIRCVPRHDAAQFSCTSARSRLAAGDRHTYAPTTITQDSLSLSLSYLFCSFISLDPWSPSTCPFADLRFPTNPHRESNEIYLYLEIPVSRICAIIHPKFA